MITEHVSLLNFFAAVRSYVTGEELRLVKPDFKQLLEAAHSHQMSALLYYTLKLNKIELPEDLADAYGQVLRKSLRFSIIQLQEYEEFKNILNKSGVVWAPIKGLVLRELYSPPELRTMGDMDVLIDERYVHIIISELTKQGYKYKGRCGGVHVCKGQVAEYELHEKVIYLDKLIADASCVKNGQMDKTRALFLLISHIGNHLRAKGCGIRQFVDIALFIRRYDTEIDAERLITYLRGIDKERFGAAVLSAVKDWFDATLSGIDYGRKYNTDSLLAAALTNGVFGKNFSHNYTAVIARLSGKKFSRTRAFFSLVFPTYNRLALRYAGLKERKYLLPFYWLKHVFGRVFKRNYRAVIRGLRVDEKSVAEQKKLLEDIYLD